MHESWIQILTYRDALDQISRKDAPLEPLARSAIGSQAERSWPQPTKPARFVYSHRLRAVYIFFQTDLRFLQFTLRPVAQQGLDESLVTADLDVQQVQNDVIAATPEAILAARDVSGIAGPDPRLLTLAEDAIREGAGAGPSGNGPEVGGNGSMKADDSTDAWRVRGLTVDDGAANAGRVSDAGVSDAGLRELDQDLRVSEQGLGVSDAGLVVSDAGLGVSDAGAPQAVPECLQGVGREEMELAFLGTGSSQPSKYRNVSAIYVHRFARGGFLMDCGEGTYGQLKRR